MTLGAKAKGLWALFRPVLDSFVFSYFRVFVIDLF